MTQITVGPPPAAVFSDLNEEAFNQWRHHPVTAAYLKFLADQAANWRTAAMDLWEVGRLDPNHAHEDLNANVLRGKVLALRDLQRITLGEIQEFYRQANDDRQDQ